MIFLPGGISRSDSFLALLFSCAVDAMILMTFESGMRLKMVIICPSFAVSKGSALNVNRKLRYYLRLRSMLSSENSQLQPNILSTTVEEEEAKRSKQLQRERALLDRTNRIRNQRRAHNNASRMASSGQHKLADQNGRQLGSVEKRAKREEENIFIDFESFPEGEEAEEADLEKHIEMQRGLKGSAKGEQRQSQMQDKEYLIALSSDEEDDNAETEGVNTPLAPLHSGGMIDSPATFSNKAVLFDISFQKEEEAEGEEAEGEEEELSQSEQQDGSSVQQPQEADKESSKEAIPLSQLISQMKEQYHLQPVPKGRVFQCVMKRERKEASTRYHLYDSLTLRNFMTVLKMEDYIVVSKYDSESSKHLFDPSRKERVVARISSNFFGTEFSTSLENVPFKTNAQYPAPARKEKVMTIEYETNILGFNGPRKMLAYVGEGSFKSSLKKVFEEEKGQRTVQRFRNKVPEWCDEAGSYVLNFHGRASVSSIKNFLMVGERDQEGEPPRVLFGKFGKELFNLDVRPPFSILQAVSLAISSFDRKLACE